MAASLDLRPLTGPIRMSVVSEASVILRLTAGPIGIRVLGQPGPQGVTGPQGDQGEPGITILPTDAPINGGFF